MVKKTLTDQELQNFRPKCLRPDGANVGRSIAVTATGFVLPCCWLDRPDGSENLLEDEKIKFFFDKELHIDNNETIEDIVSSDTWQKFMSDLINRPEESAPICLKMCSSEGNIHRRQEKWL